MNDELENQLKSMSLKEPSQGLNFRIQELLRAGGSMRVEKPVALQSSNWQTLCITASACLAVGFGLGVLFGNVKSDAQVTPKFAAGGIAHKYGSPIAATETENTEPFPGEPNLANGTLIPSSTDTASTDRQRSLAVPTGSTSDVSISNENRYTTILAQRWVETPDGQLARGYFTTTRRRVWRQDTETQALRAYDTTHPRLIVSTTPGI
jgi:hypothetical protein